ncbi:MAG: orc1/cdc6 family replication initiation protein [Candidatus Diapherotrites archaeon]
MGEKNLFEGLTGESKIFKDREKITPHYTPEKLPFREKQIEEMALALKSALAGQKADNLFLYGKPGTGKTACTRHVLFQLQEFIKKNSLNATAIYLNCRNYNSKYKVLSTTVQSLYPEKDFIGYSGSFIYEKLTEFCSQKGFSAIIALDEIDKVKDLDDLVYALTRANDEIKKGSISLIGISNMLTFKERLDPRTKSSLCEKELVFPPYNAQELKKILEERSSQAFHEGIIQDSAINLASAIAAQESGDARTAVMLLLRAGEIAERENLDKITDKEVEKARKSVEEQIVFEMISTLPEQQQLVLLSIAKLTMDKKGVKRLKGEEQGILFSGEVFDEYRRLATAYKKNSVSIRWFQQYINELEMYGLLSTTASGKGLRGNTRLIRLSMEAKEIKNAMEKQLNQ